jgi:hypothetical protein
MQLQGAIEALEALGFRICRRLRRGDELCGADLVHTLTDIHAALRLADGRVCSTLSGASLGYDGGIFFDTDPLLRMLARCLKEAARQSVDLDNCCSPFEGTRRDAVTSRLSALATQRAAGSPAWWWGERGYLKVLYRGMVVEVDDHLDIVSCDEMQPVLTGRRPGVMSLHEAMDQIDMAGGFEDEQCGEPATPIERRVASS